MLTDQAGQRRFIGACPGTALAGPGDAENHLIGVTAPGVASTLSYDPIGRLNHIVTNGTATNFVWDGDDLLVEYDATSTNVLRRFIHGPGDDNPLIWFEGPYMDQNHRQSLIADHQGSIVGVTNAAGALTSSLTYDPYGSTPSFAGPRFRYTGQIAIPEIGLYYYKARFYDPVAQRFLQTDPIGMKSDENLYAYVRDDPADRTDSSGLSPDGEYHPPPPVTGTRLGNHAVGSMVSSSYGAGHNAGRNHGAHSATAAKGAPGNGASHVAGNADQTVTAVQGAAGPAGKALEPLSRFTGAAAATTEAIDEIGNGKSVDSAVVTAAAKFGLSTLGAGVGGGLGFAAGGLVPLGGETGITEAMGGAVGATKGAGWGENAGAQVGEGYDAAKNAFIRAINISASNFAAAAENIGDYQIRTRR